MFCHDPLLVIKAYFYFKKNFDFVENNIRLQYFMPDME